MEHFDALREGWVWGLSAIAGAVGFGQEYSKEDQWKMHVWKLLLRLITSIFAGLVAYALSIWLKFEPPMQFVTVAMLSWSGIKGLEVILTVVKDALQKGAQGSGK